MLAETEVVDPICLASKVIESCHCHDECQLSEVPESICRCFDEEITLSNDFKRWYVTLGQFSIVKLERDIQLLMPAYDICIPDKECADSADDPCSLFAKFKFPVDEFFPPNEECLGDTIDTRRRCCN